MGNVKDFEKAIRILREKDQEEAAAELAMADMTNWCFVHTTRYLPRRNRDGDLYIPTTAMATDFEAGRFTVHATLNRTVKSHLYGSWDDAQFVVLAPYTDIVKENGNPVTVAPEDTYWVPSPDKGLLLPKSAYIVQPDNSGPLFQIGEHGATYKTGDFTENEIKEISQLLDWDARGEYDRLMSGDLYLYEIEDVLKNDLVRRGYETSSDKKAYLSGIMYEARMDILTHFLRDAVVKLSMKHMKMNWYEFSVNSDVVTRTAVSHGLYVEGHTHRPYGRLDHVAETIELFFEYGWGGDRPAVFKTDVKSLYDAFEGWYTCGVYPEVTLAKAIIDDLIENKPVNLLEIYQNEYAKYWEAKFTWLRNNYDDYDKKIVQVTHNTDMTVGDMDVAGTIQHYEKQKSLIMDEIHLTESRKKTIDDNKNMWESIRRQCVHFESKYSAWRDEIIKSPGYENLVQKLRILVAAPSYVNRRDFER